MNWIHIYNQAYELALRCNQLEIISDLQYLNKIELVCVVRRLTRIQEPE